MNKEIIFEKLRGLIKAHGPNRLARESGVSRQGIHRLLNEKNPRYETLDRIATALHLDLDLTRELPTTEKIYSSLKFYGAPISAKQTDIPITLEESLAWGVSLSRTDGFIGSMIPYLLHIKIAELNIPRLIALCDGLSESRTLGYYTEVANAFRAHKKLSRLIDVLSDLHFEKEPLLKNTKQTESFKKLTKMVKNPFAKKWKLLTIDNLHYHFERYHKWQLQS